MRAGEFTYEALIKLKLVHARGFTVILPELITVDVGEWCWIQPQYFSPCLLSFLDGQVMAQMGVEPVQGVKLTVGFTGDRLVRAYDDGSFLYRCRITSPIRIKGCAAGNCSIDAEYRIWLDLFHHTSAQACSAIRRSGHFRGSRWNIQGNKELNNVEYAYFTNLPRISNRKHLKRIAMASDGEIHLIPTNGSFPDDIISIEVYRESTLNRRHTIRAKVPADIIATQHVWRHDALDQPTYYEVSHPAIYRVGLKPHHVLEFREGVVCPDVCSLKSFDYVVLGYAVSPEGLRAPYDEEDTRELFTIERCANTKDLFTYWQENANSDLYTGRVVELQTFKPQQA